MELRQGKVLVVDDSPLSQVIVSKNLQKLGQKVVVANNGKEAVDLIQKDTFDLIFMDLYMPVMSGYEAIRIIKHVLKLSVPIVVMTAFQIEDEKMELKEIGITEQLNKPIDFTKMTNILTKYLNQRISMNQIQGIDEIIIDQIHIEGIDLKAGLAKQNNNLEFYHKLLESFCSHYENFSFKMKSTIAHSPGDFQQHIRKLLVTAQELSLTEIEHQCIQILEYSIESGSTHLLDLLLYDLDAVLFAIHDYLHGLYINPNIIINHHKLKEIDILHDMHYYLTRKRPRQVKENLEIIKRLDHVAQYKPLIHAIAEYNYAEAALWIEQHLKVLKGDSNE